MRNLFNIPLGACTAPFGSPKKEIFNAFANIISSLINTGNVSATNEANTWNNIITNNMNKQINDDQLAWARENYEMEKAENRFLVDQAYQRELENRAHQEQYNSPAETKQRWIDAGFNPSLMMSPTGLQSGSLSSVGSSVGSPPRHNQPNMIPMQQAAPAIPYQIPDGLGIGKDLDFYLADRASEREDYRLASDITFKTTQSRLDYLRYRMDNSKSQAERDYFKKLTDHLDKQFVFEQDKFFHQMDMDSFYKELAQYRNRIEDKKVAIEAMLAQSKISLDAASIEELAAMTEKLYKEAYELSASGASKREIDKWVADQEKQIDGIMKSKAGDINWQDDNYITRGYRRITNWMVDPLKGIFSGNASFKVK